MIKYVFFFSLYSHRKNKTNKSNNAQFKELFYYAIMINSYLVQQIKGNFLYKPNFRTRKSC